MATADEFIAEAETWIGTLYVYGGTTRAGVDCSGYVMAVCDFFDIACPRTAEEQRQFFPATTNPQPGDEIFFYVPSDGLGPGVASHCGIYLGPNTFLDAPETWVAPGVRGRVSIQSYPFPGGTVLGYGALPFSAPATPPIDYPPVQEASMTANTPQGGLLVVGADGGVFCYNGAGYFGSLPGLGVRPAKPVTGICSTPTGNGYWLCGLDGGVFAFGDAPYLGNALGKGGLYPCVGVEPMKGGGYVLTFHLTPGPPPLLVPVVALSAAGTDDAALLIHQTGTDDIDGLEHHFTTHPGALAA